MLAIIAAAVHPTPSAASAWTREVGPAEAPSGYVEFCGDEPLQCVPHGVAKPQAMDERHWRELQEANTLANHMIEPLSDIDQHSRAEVWAIPVMFGDCEDYQP